MKQKWYSLWGYSYSEYWPTNFQCEPYYSFQNNLIVDICSYFVAESTVVQQRGNANRPQQRQIFYSYYIALLIISVFLSVTEWDI